MDDPGSHLPLARWKSRDARLNLMPSALEGKPNGWNNYENRVQEFTQLGDDFECLARTGVKTAVTQKVTFILNAP